MFKILAYIGYFFLLINLILFSTQFFKESKAYKIFTIYLALVLVIQVWAETLIQQRMSNLFLSHFYFIGQFVGLSLFYWHILRQKNSQRQFVLGGLVVALIILGIQYCYDTSLFFRFNLFEIILTSFILIVWASTHFYNLLNEKKEFYYANIGILMYLLGSTILFLVGNLMTSLSPTLNQIPWIINSFLYIIYQIFILFDWKDRYSRKELNTIL